MKSVKNSLIILFSLLVFAANARQTVLTDEEINDLIVIGEYYSGDHNFFNKKEIDQLKKYKKGRFGQIVRTFGVMADRSKDILTPAFLKKPSHDELVFWYIISEIHQNKTDKEATPKPAREVVEKYLNEKTDERLLLDNYYYRIRGAVAFLLNDTNLSKANIQLDQLGLANTTEKAILYFHITEACVTRFRVLQAMKNSPKILEFAEKCPRFNGKPYFEYTDFNFEDFQWVGDDKTESYSARRFSGLYSAVMAHLNAIFDVKGKAGREEGISFYKNSILSHPEYYKYSGAEETLKELQTIMEKAK